MVIQPKTGKDLGNSFHLIVYILLVGKVTIVNGQIEWSQSSNFNRIQDGGWLKSSCVKSLKFHNVPYLGFVQFSAVV